MHIHGSDKFHKRSRKGPVSTGKKGNEQFAAAIVLARKGRYIEASKLLRKARDNGECSEAVALDLQARIYAQHGQYIEAEACWRRAKILDSSNYAFDKSIERLHRARPSIDRIYKGISIFIILAFFVVILWQVRFVNQDLGRRFDESEISLADLSEKIAAFRSDSQSSKQQVGSAIAELDHAFLEHEARIMTKLEAILTASEILVEHKKIIDSVQETVVQVDKTVKDIESESQSRNQGIISSVAALDSRLRDLHERILVEFKTLLTTSRAAQDRDVILRSTESALAQITKAGTDRESRLVKLIDVLESGLHQEFSQLSVEVQELKRRLMTGSK